MFRRNIALLLEAGHRGSMVMFMRYTMSEQHGEMTCLATLEYAISMYSDYFCYEIFFHFFRNASWAWV